MVILILIAKLSLVTVLPVAAVFIWQRRSKAHWSSLLFSLVAFAIHYLAEMSLNQRVGEFTLDPAFAPIAAFFAANLGGTYFPSILHAFIFGVIREGARWLIFRYAATKMRLWQDGVLFGMGYSVIALLQLVGEHFVRVWPSLNLSENTIIEKIEFLNYVYGWTATWYFPFYWVVSLLAFNVCVSVAVLASVQRRKTRYLLIALVVYIVYAAAPPEMMKHFSEMNIDWLGLGQDASRIIKQQLIHPLMALFFLLVIFRLRKTMQ